MEKTYKYTAKIGQPQKVADIRIDPNGGTITERELRVLKKDVYGASLLEKGMLFIETASEPAPAPAENSENSDQASGETIPDFDEGENKGYEGKGDSSDQEHAGWKPPK